MSWLARSIANSLKLEDDDDDGHQHNSNLTDSNSPPNPKSDHHDQPSSPSSATTPRGVKEDLSELTKTLTLQFWGVASFLAPPPDSSSSSPSAPSSQISDNPQPHQPPDPEASDEDLISGIRSDFAEIGGKFKSGISKLSNNAAVSEFTKIASNFIQLASDRDLNDEDLISSVVGVTDEVVLFARDIAMHPETWLDFPVPAEDFDDFDMSDAQQEHALAVERLVPRLAVLRIELCPGYMSEGCFWKIYFVLLHPKLSKNDAELLSTTEIVKARAMLSHELNNQTRGTKAGWSGSGTSGSQETADLPHEESLSVPSCAESESVNLKTANVEVVHVSVSDKTPDNEACSSVVEDELESEKHPIQSNKNQIVDNAVVEEVPVSHSQNQDIPISASKILEEKFEDDADDWLKEESSEIVGASGSAMHIGNDEDVSFSDLEEDDVDVPTSYKKVILASDTSVKNSRDWIQLSKSSANLVEDIKPVNMTQARSEQVSSHNSESKESNDWLDVDDIDVV